MIKKYFLPLFLIWGMSMATSACSPEHETEISETPAPTPEPDESPVPPTGNSHSLVVYFSCTNTTKGIAERITAVTSGTIFRIEPEDPYTSADLDYNNSSSRANREQNDPSARPAIANTLEGLENYDVVFLGYPIWWGDAPKIISTFLDSYDLSGKTIVPFCTSHSSGIGSSDTDLHPLEPQAVWKDGRRFGGNESEEVIREWIEGLGLSFTHLSN